MNRLCSDCVWFMDNNVDQFVDTDLKRYDFIWLDTCWFISTGFICAGFMRTFYINISYITVGLYPFLLMVFSDKLWFLLRAGFIQACCLCVVSKQAGFINNGLVKYSISVEVENPKVNNFHNTSYSILKSSLLQQGFQKSHFMEKACLIKPKTISFNHSNNVY